EPAAIAGTSWPAALDRSPLEGLAVVREMLEILAHRPHLSTAGLLEHWRERPEAGLLGRLAATEPLPLTAEQAATEFRDALHELERAPRKRRLAALKARSSERALDADEQAELRLLLRLQGLEGRREHSPAEQAEFKRLQADYAAQ